MLAVAIIVIALAICAYLKIYYIRDESGGQVLWNSNEAYLVIHVHRSGFRVRYLEYPWVRLREYLHGVRLPDDERLAVNVIHVTSSTTDRESGDFGRSTNPPDFITPSDGHIYANCQGVLCKWSGTHFEPATEKQKQNFDGINHLLSDIDGESDGWSKRGFGGGRNYEFRADAGGHFIISVKETAPQNLGYTVLSIYLQRAGQPPERIWYGSSIPRRVTWAAYRELF
jgi:hypothetical protein